MRTVFLTLVITVVFVIACGVGFIYSGVYNVAAADPHWPVTYRAMEALRNQSIRAHAAGITTPTDLTSEARLVMGTEHFAAHCAVCHGAPGVPRGDIAEGLYPHPPDLAQAAQRYTPGELFWILKNGIKMSGMPAWQDHSDDELWSTVGFIERLPGMSESDYGKLVVQSMAQGGHHHHHGDEDSATPAMDHSAMPGMKTGQWP